MNKIENVIIVGSGPAAHTAAIYTSRAKLEPLMFEGFLAGGVAAGGQLTTTTEVENFPGYLSIPGPQLMQKMRDQAVHCGTRIETKTIDKVDLKANPLKLYAGSEEFQAKTVIIATGATAKRLNLPGEDRLWQKGISACAVCDGALPIYRNKHLVVVGGGDTACEESLFLTKYAAKVSILVRRDVMRASKTMQQRVKENKKIEIIWNTVPLEVLGDKQMSGIKTANVKTHEHKTLEAGGLFYAIGHQPNTAFLNNQIQLDETGYIVTKPGTTQTSLNGVFACGDVQDKIYRQAITAAGTGCMAALDVERYLSHG